MVKFFGDQIFGWSDFLKVKMFLGHLSTEFIFSSLVNVGQTKKHLWMCRCGWVAVSSENKANTASA